MTVAAVDPVARSDNESPGRDMEIWVDGQKVAENLKQTYSYHDFVQASVPMDNGQHQVDVFSVGWEGSLLLDSFPLTVGSDSVLSARRWRAARMQPVGERGTAGGLAGAGVRGRLGAERERRSCGWRCGWTG